MAPTGTPRITRPVFASRCTFPVTSGGSIQYLRMSEMNLGGSDPTNGLKWFVFFACDSLHQANWNSMINAGQQPYNGNMHLILGANSVIRANTVLMQKWAQYMNYGKGSFNPMTIQDAWYQASQNAYRHGAAPIRWSWRWRVTLLALATTFSQAAVRAARHLDLPPAAGLAATTMRNAIVLLVLLPMTGATGFAQSLLLQIWETGFRVPIWWCGGTSRPARCRVRSGSIACGPGRSRQPQSRIWWRWADSRRETSQNPTRKPWSIRAAGGIPSFNWQSGTEALSIFTSYFTARQTSRRACLTGSGPSSLRPIIFQYSASTL